MPTAPDGSFTTEPSVPTAPFTFSPKPQPTPEVVVPVEPTDEQIKQRAAELWHNAGEPAGQDHEFWLKAEEELKAQP